MPALKESLGNSISRSASGQYYLAVGTVLCISSILYVFEQHLGYQTVSLFLLLVVASLSLIVRVAPVMVAATVSALIWNFFFIPPHFTFAIGLPQDVLLFFSYFIIAAITGILTTRIRARERHATALYTFTKQLVAAKNLDDVAEAAVRNISLFFNTDIVLYLSTLEGDIVTTPHPSSTMNTNEKEQSIASWAYWNEKKAGKYVDMLPFTETTYYPISGPRYPLGVIGVKIKNDKQFSVNQEILLHNFIAQIASTLEREQLNELTKRTIVYAESEKLYKTLFNSISHELRTPIAAIVSASEGLNEQTQSTARRKEFIDEIHTAAERLNRLVENLLDMTRLESGQLAPKLDWCDVRDVVNASAKKLEKELSDHIVNIEIAENLPLAKLDFGLMEQAITNLLHNASQYTPAGTKIAIKVLQREHELFITIHDTGPGFPAEALKKLFEKFYRVPGTKAGGTGLGLSIAKGFIEAHKGSIAASNHSNGGAMFEIKIPLNE
ncbi:MAG: DUF4118 domain-containing protein [Ignavibacteriales bacterium]|nr:DUF4118 domain-containing protein [Ignavibacteriales bacterium]